MKKSTYYFSHDYHARSDGKLIKVMMKHGVEGIGIYWCLIEMLYENEGIISTDEYERISFELRTNVERITSMIHDFGLFQNDGKFFWSESVNRRIEHLKNKSIKARESVNLRWKRKENTNVLQSNNDSNTIKYNEIKSNEIKSNNIKVNNNNNDNNIELSKDNSLHKSFIAEYDLFFNSYFGFKPNYTAADFKAVKLLIKYFNSNTNGDESKSLDAWKIVLKNWDNLSDFYKQKSTLREINSNITKILIEIKSNQKKENAPIGNINKQYHDLIERIKKNG